MTTPHEYARAQADAFRAQLHELIRIPSVSADPAYAPHMQRAASWLADHLNGIGLSAEVIPAQGHPLVYAEWLKAGPDARTLLIYGHYDVQPAALEDGWDSDPFEPVEKNGAIYARGADDNKGQFFAHVKAVESILAARGALPLNIKIILEGEEESGGESIARYVAESGARLAADVCVISDSSILTPDQPSIVYALRGIAAMELRVTGPSHDLHSGSYGGSVHNPLQALTEIVAALHDADGRVTVPGFYDDVLALSDQERAELAKIPWTEADWQAQTGAPQSWGEAGYSLRERTGARPTLEVNGLGGGYAGQGFKTVLPASGIAKISCRLVANQDPYRIYERIRDYIASITPPTVRSELIYLSGGHGAQVDINDPAMQAAVMAYEKIWGARPVFMREGGSLPIVAEFQRHLNVPVILMGFGLDSDGIHGPNEHFPVALFHKGVDTAIHFYYALAGAEA